MGGIGNGGKWEWGEIETGQMEMVENGNGGKLKWET